MDDLLIQIKNGLEANMRYVDIAEEVKITLSDLHGYINKYFHEYSIDERLSSDVETIRDLIKIYRNTPKDLAAAYGCSVAVISTFIKKRVKNDSMDSTPSMHDTKER
jgi:hypothetical protein